MWTCPKCGRTFKNQNQDHFCGKAPETIDAYILEQPEDIQKYLYQMHGILQAALPDVQERISWSMPTYWNQHNIVHFAGFKKHIGFYPGPQAIEMFEERLKEYKTSKGAVQFPYNKPLPAELITEIAKWCNDTGNNA